MLKKLSMIVLTITFSASMAFASGFSIYEQGAKATAMGGAFIAQANDVTGVFYNPAGITSLSGVNFGLGTTIIMPSFSFEGPVGPFSDDTDAEEGVFTPVTFYATYQINEELSAGFSFYTLYGLGSEWPGDWVGRELATTSEIQTFFLNPVVAYKVMDGLSLAVGFSVAIGNVSLEQSNLLGPNTYSESKLDGSATGYGFNLGAQYKLNDQLTLGAVYRSNMLLEFEDGDVTFNPQVPGVLTNTKGSSEIELPTLMGVGVSYQFTEHLVAEFDWMQLGWSSYDELTIKYDSPLGPPGGQFTERTVERNYEDSFSLRFGLEYVLNEDWAIRAGYLRDNKAVPDENVEPSLPEGDRNLYSLGVGYTMDNLTIDAFFMLLIQEDRKITNSEETILGGAVPFNGTYKGGANLFGVSFGYSL